MSNRRNVRVSAPRPDPVNPRPKRVSALDAAIRIELSSRTIKRKQRPKYTGHTTVSRLTPGGGVHVLTRATGPFESKTQAEISALISSCLELMRISLSPDAFQRVSTVYLAAPANNPSEDVEHTCRMIAERRPDEVIIGSAIVQEVHPDGTMIDMPLTIGSGVFGCHGNGV